MRSLLVLIILLPLLGKTQTQSVYVQLKDASGKSLTTDSGNYGYDAETKSAWTNF